MPQRPYSPGQGYLLPPDPEEWVEPHHPVRFVKLFVESLELEVWTELGVEPAAERGAARFDPKVLLSAILAGFMMGLRSNREIERACRELLPFRYLLAGQTPDHNTIWRFQRDHRPQIEALLRQTVRTAVAMELVDLALQAVDGTKILANARKNRTLTVEELAILDAQVEAAIAELAQQESGDAMAAAQLPEGLHDMTVLRERIAAARQQVERTGQSRVNLTDPEARMMHTPVGKRPAYNAQAVVTALNLDQAGCTGRFVMGADVVCEGTDNHLLKPMIDGARVEGHPVPVTVADAGYHSGATLEACAQAGYTVVVPESMPATVRGGPYHHDRFVYDARTDTVQCPQGQTLQHFVTRQDGSRRYRGAPAVCAVCPAYTQCYRGQHPGNPRMIRIGRYDAQLRAHRAMMATEEAQAVRTQRLGLIEPVFGILKEQMGARRWLHRGLDKVRAEWTWLAVAFNLRTLAKVWATGLTPGAASPPQAPLHRHITSPHDRATWLRRFLAIPMYSNAPLK